MFARSSLKPVFFVDKKPEPQFETLEQRKDHDAYVFFHEFLYIVCNSQDRVDQINKNHKLDLRSELYYINQWELDRTRY